jgi:hypothetical protein
MPIPSCRQLRFVSELMLRIDNFVALWRQRTAQKQII